MAYLLLSYGVNKLLPGQFLLYNRDLDLVVRDLPARRLAWHFLGQSPLYIAFIAGLELLSGALLCWSRTALGGLLLAAGVTMNIVVIDAAFGIRALPIPAPMALAVFTLIVGHLRALRPLVWPERTSARSVSILARGGILSLGMFLVMQAFLIRQGLGSRRGLMGQLPAAGRWEVVRCRSDPGLAMCRRRPDGTGAVLYLEIGHWGELVTDSGRHPLTFSYDTSRNLEITIEPGRVATDARLTLRGVLPAELETAPALGPR